ncbi:MAG: hypothetical protein E5Y89_00685 [Mesorhizobium sp.]|nr:MAG: hypothetical protein E5Y89_00685 [Mesorhizobium sp.]
MAAENSGRSCLERGFEHDCLIDAQSRRKASPDCLSNASMRKGRESRCRADARFALTRKLRCAVYTRQSNEEGLETEFNSLDAQRVIKGDNPRSARSSISPIDGLDRVDDRADTGALHFRKELFPLDSKASAVLCP